MMLDWNGYREQLVETIGKMLRLSPDTQRAAPQSVFHPPCLRPRRSPV
jgi:hypothetical protein